MVKNLDVICIGAALVDIIAKIERHPIEDDEVFVPNLQILSGGAAANTAFACALLGLKVAFIGKLGYDDEFGNKIINDFKDTSLDTTLIKYSKNFGTGFAYVAIDKNGERRIYAYSGAANTLSPNEIASKEIVQTKLLFLSNLKNLEPLKKAAKIAKDNKIPVILNPGMLIIEQGFEDIKELLRNTDILIISKREFLYLFQLDDDKLINYVIKERAKKLFKIGIKVIIITMGKEGAIVINSEKSESIKPIKVAKVIDTTGAGDAFSAGFIYGFIRTLSFKFEDLKYNAKIGNFVAGKCIQKLGARNGIPTCQEIELTLSNY
ncbi:MAG: carbohydrate kinase family protein [Candidatus Lokiarchaeota archaeon]|nr:carbohydrate kinase family protein [Candidatus Lokiarchaeota archaeon]MCK4479926.1 carbohydrate kinase family protein [Candidatus Lokiarchaeota archaeon]